MTSALERLAFAKYERQQSPTRLEHDGFDDDGIRRIVTPDRFRPWTADLDYLARTAFTVTAETFAREERRREIVAARDGGAPPPGLICSARLGQVATLL